MSDADNAASPITPEAGDARLEHCDDGWTDDESTNTASMLDNSFSSRKVQLENPIEAVAIVNNNEEPRGIPKSSTSDFSLGEDIYDTSFHAEDNTLRLKLTPSHEIMFVLSENDAVSDILGKVQKEAASDTKIAVRHRNNVEYAGDTRLRELCRHGGFLIDIGDLRNLVTVQGDAEARPESSDPSPTQISTTGTEAESTGIEVTTSPSPGIHDVADNRARFSFPEGDGFLDHMKIQTTIHTGRQALQFASEERTPEHLQELYMRMAGRSGCVKVDGIEYYNMGNKEQYKGRVLVINVFDFKCNATRYHSKKDMENIVPLFTSLGFQVVSKPLSHTTTPNANIMQVLDEEFGNPEYSQRRYMMFILIVMTHGDIGKLSNPDESMVHLKDIYRKLSPDQFKSMEGKPKLVVVQACNGADDARVHEVCADAMDFNLQPSPSPVQAEQPSSLSPGGAIQAQESPLPTSKRMDGDDICIWLASFPGNVSWKDFGGSWLIRAITETFYKHAHHAHLDELFEHVRVKVREYSLYYEEEATRKRNEFRRQTSTTIHQPKLAIALQRGIRSLLSCFRAQKSQNLKTTSIEDSYAQHPCQMNFFIRKRRLYFFPNMESYKVKFDTDAGICTISNNPTVVPDPTL